MPISQKSPAPADDCPCRDGMFPAGAVSRRFLFAAGAASAMASHAAAAEIPPDSTRTPGRATGADGGYGARSPFEKDRRVPGPVPNDLTTWTFTPLASQYGETTASSLHYERHHSGIPAIDPARHALTVHGLVTTPKRFTMDDVKRVPRISRTHFIECSGNTGGAYQNLPLKTVQVSHGLLSTSEWTGVPFATLAREVGIAPNAAWVLAEGADGAVMTRSLPLEKMMRDAILAYGQNGEAIRPEQGYPLRLVLPGYEGNTHIKWLRRLQISDKPFMTREETSKYTDLTATGIARQFVFPMQAKSVITFPSGDMKLPGPGCYEIGGLAWSGLGRVRHVEVSTDGGQHWHMAALNGTPRPICTVRFTHPWVWDGKPTQLLSRCTDETGAVQPTRDALIRDRGLNYYYHYNSIYPWSVAADGSVSHAIA